MGLLGGAWIYIHTSGHHSTAHFRRLDTKVHSVMVPSKGSTQGVCVGRGTAIRVESSTGKYPGRIDVHEDAPWGPSARPQI
jgi:hypothetical protein